MELTERAGTMLFTAAFASLPVLIFVSGLVAG